jgi:predicted RNA-binding Zn-ribbon protein involved in translation (DUF1610 family)
MPPFTPPDPNLTAFNCPHCDAYAAQRRDNLLFSPANVTSWTPFEDLTRLTCGHCGEYTLWRAGEMIYPAATSAPLPNEDLSAEIKADYAEAASILTRSPRGAAALLRLCVQKLCQQLGRPGDNLNADIAALVKEGLPARVQQALDVVRVVGNNAVHPGVIDLKDDRETAMRLFGLLNLIADVMVTQPKHVDALYESLPETARQAIEQRDRPALPAGKPKAS